MKKMMILAAFIVLFSGQAIAAEAVMPIKATIVQCGARAELVKACQRDDRCCPLLHSIQIAGDAAVADPVDEAMIDPELINRNLGMYAHRSDNGASASIVIE